jgi:hypothetical protein
MRSPSLMSGKGVWATLALTALAVTVAGCASGRMATLDERAAMQTALQQYTHQSRLSGAVELNKTVRVKDSQANVGYTLYEPHIQLVPLHLHAKMVRDETGWTVVSNNADPTIHDLSVWPMVRITSPQ